MALPLSSLEMIRWFSITEHHDTILSNLFSNIKGKGTHCIFDLDKEVDVRNVAGSQGKVETSLEEVKGERINGVRERLTTSLDSQLLIGLRLGADLGRGQPNKEGEIDAEMTDGGTIDKEGGHNYIEWVEFSTRGMVRKEVGGA
ncbi:hypothetical protein SUGI_0537200 [Cryptomeria japonica]|nr:hypothetical protein SUGI_0537200 [Cryptomeria japonica]